MQFLEKSVLGVRSALHRLEHRSLPLSFLLVPMVHVAEPSFYLSVRSRLRGCNIVFAEGVDSRTVGIIALSYNLLGRFKKFGLSRQGESGLLEGFAGEVVRSDVSGAEFDLSWSTLPLRIRIFVLLAAPYVGFRNLFSRSGRDIAKHLETSSLPTRREILASDDRLAIDSVVLESRDQHLAGVLDNYIQQSGSEPRSAAIVYGAAHMPAIWRFLSSRGYRQVSSEWVRVMSSHAT